MIGRISYTNRMIREAEARLFGGVWGAEAPSKNKVLKLAQDMPGLMLTLFTPGVTQKYFLGRFADKGNDGSGALGI
jgi:hypothetical protein